MEMDTTSDYSVIVSPYAPVEDLGISVRAFNALKRRGDVNTVADLIRLVETEELHEVRNIGTKSVAEIENILSRIHLTEPIERKSDVAQDELAQLRAENEALQRKNVDLQQQLWQLVAVLATAARRQLASGLLHQDALVLSKSIANWLESTEKVDVGSAVTALTAILESSTNVCDELAYIFAETPTRDITILLSRYGGVVHTLDEIGKDLNLTRERVRQLCVRIAEEVETATMGFRSTTLAPGIPSKGFSVRPPLVRVQSALLKARDMGLDISFATWKRDILTSGLVGRLELSNLREADPVELMLATCKASCDSKHNGLAIPENLLYAIEAAVAGEPDLPARVLHLRATLPLARRKLITRHARFTGAVNARWLATEMGTDLGYAQDVLRAVGFRAYSGDWFTPSTSEQEYDIDAHDVFHHALRKMSQYCGPLSVEDICGGLRYAVSRTDFPVPPPDVTTYLLEEYGYACSDNLFCWDKPVNETLSEGEKIIMECLERNGPVVHHAELAGEFIRSPLSFATLHATLGHSPIFEKIDSGLYKLRGASVTTEDIQRAEAAAEVIPLNLSVQYDRRGLIIIGATLSALTIGNGTFISEQLPNLAGSWKCLVYEQQADMLEVTPNEFRHLRNTLDLLDCHIGDRILFTFNTWTRSVMIEKVSKQNAN